MTSLFFYREMCGESRVAVKTPSTYSTEWANLEEAESKNVAAFIDQKIRDHYLFDWSLPLNAPALAKEFQVHKYFQVRDFEMPNNLFSLLSPFVMFVCIKFVLCNSSLAEKISLLFSLILAVYIWRK